jgi:hypothetical protein
MKKTLLIALLLIPCLGFSQTLKPITSFLGIKFGSTKAIVIASMKAKGAVVLKQADPTIVVFDNVKLGSRTAKSLVVGFVNNQAYGAEFTFATDVEAELPGYYQGLVNDFTDVYGKGVVTRQFNDPYVEGDGNELIGLSAGKIIYNTVWTDSNKNDITISITTDMEVSVFYTDDALSNKQTDKEKTKNKSDL